MLSQQLLRNVKNNIYYIKLNKNYLNTIYLGGTWQLADFGVSLVCWLESEGKLLRTYPG